MDQTIFVWEASTGKQQGAIRDDRKPLFQLVAAGDGRRVVASVDPGIIATYDSADGKRVSSFDAREQANASSKDAKVTVVLSPDGEMAAASADDGTVRLWNVPAKERIGADLSAHDGAISGLCLTPDKKTLVTADKHGEIKIWDLATREARKVKAGPTGEEKESIPAHKAGLLCLTVSPDGSRFATAGMDGAVKLWDLATGKLLREWEFKQPAVTGRSFVRSLAFTPDGKHLATANANTTAYLLDCP
jgi:WD40 repeat protein